MRQTTKKLGQAAQSAQSKLVLCEECLTGKMHLQHLTYFTWLNNELITAPNFPAWVCDVCGRREYDQRAVQWLNTLLDPEAGKGLTTRRKTKYNRGNQPQA